MTLSYVTHRRRGIRGHGSIPHKKEEKVEEPANMEEEIDDDSIDIKTMTKFDIERVLPHIIERYIEDERLANALYDLILKYYELPLPLWLYIGNNAQNVEHLARFAWITPITGELEVVYGAGIVRRREGTTLKQPETFDEIMRYVTDPFTFQESTSKKYPIDFTVMRNHARDVHDKSSTIVIYAPHYLYAQPATTEKRRVERGDDLEVIKIISQSSYTNADTFELKSFKSQFDNKFDKHFVLTNDVTAHEFYIKFLAPRFGETTISISEEKKIEDLFRYTNFLFTGKPYYSLSTTLRELIKSDAIPEAFADVPQNGTVFRVFDHKQLPLPWYIIKFVQAAFRTYLHAQEGALPEHVDTEFKRFLDIFPLGLYSVSLILKEFSGLDETSAAKKLAMNKHPFGDLLMANVRARAVGVASMIMENDLKKEEHRRFMQQSEYLMYIRDLYGDDVATKLKEQARIQNKRVLALLSQDVIGMIEKLRMRDKAHIDNLVRGRGKCMHYSLLLSATSETDKRAPSSFRLLRRHFLSRYDSSGIVYCKLCSLPIMCIHNVYLLEEKLIQNAKPGKVDKLKVKHANMYVCKFCGAILYSVQESAEEYSAVVGNPHNTRLTEDAYMDLLDEARLLSSKYVLTKPVIDPGSLASSIYDIVKDRVEYIKSKGGKYIESQQRRFFKIIDRAALFAQYINLAKRGKITLKFDLKNRPRFPDIGKKSDEFASATQCALDRVFVDYVTAIKIPNYSTIDELYSSFKVLMQKFYEVFYGLKSMVYAAPTKEYIELRLPDISEIIVDVIGTGVTAEENDKKYADGFVALVQKIKKGIGENMSDARAIALGIFGRTYYNEISKLPVPVSSNIVPSKIIYTFSMSPFSTKLSDFSSATPRVHYPVTKHERLEGQDALSNTWEMVCFINGAPLSLMPHDIDPRNLTCKRCKKKYLTLLEPTKDDIEKNKDKLQKLLDLRNEPIYVRERVAILEYKKIKPPTADEVVKKMENVISKFANIAKVNTKKYIEMFIKPFDGTIMDIKMFLSRLHREYLMVANSGRLTHFLYQYAELGGKLSHMKNKWIDTDKIDDIIITKYLTTEEKKRCLKMILFDFMDNLSSSAGAKVSTEFLKLFIEKVLIDDKILRVSPEDTERLKKNLDYAEKERWAKYLASDEWEKVRTGLVYMIGEEQEEFFETFKGSTLLDAEIEAERAS